MVVFVAKLEIIYHFQLDSQEITQLIIYKSIVLITSNDAIGSSLANKNIWCDDGRESKSFLFIAAWS